MRAASETRIQINFYDGAGEKCSIRLKPGTTTEQAAQVARDITAGFAEARPRITTEGSLLWYA